MKKNDEMNLERYFLVPVFLLRGLTSNKEKALNGMIDFGVYNLSKKIKFNGDVDDELYEGARQLMYCYYRRPELIPTEILLKLEHYIDIDKVALDENYNGFDGSNFKPEYELEGLLRVAHTDPIFYDQIIHFGKLKSTFSLLSIDGSMDAAYKNAQEIEKKMGEKEPMVMINRDHAFNFRDSEKSEFELMTFAVYLGIRSILGEKSYCKTTKQMILARAFGFKDHSELMMNKPKLYDKYNNRYWFDKVLAEIENGNWNIITYSYRMRGLYIGYSKKISLEKLIEKVESKRAKSKVEGLKKKKQLIRKNIIENMNLQK
jgi:hypothetical protein